MYFMAFSVVPMVLVSFYNYQQARENLHNSAVSSLKASGLANTSFIKK